MLDGEDAPESATAGQALEEEGASAADDLEEGAAPALEEEENVLPRWRDARDLQTVMYCLWRRRAYIRSGRLFAGRKCWTRALEEA